MIYGIGPAARYYFNTSASELSLGQALYISSILPKPKQQHFAIGGAVGIAILSSIGIITVFGWVYILALTFSIQDFSYLYDPANETAGTFVPAQILYDAFHGRYAFDDSIVVATAVLVFRALTYVLPIPIGLGTYVFWRHNRSWRREPNTAPRTQLVPESV